MILTKKAVRILTPMPLMERLDYLSRCRRDLRELASRSDRNAFYGLQMIEQQADALPSLASSCVRVERRNLPSGPCLPR